MRLFTYVGFVARRVWAKKGIQFGSLLGATLVISLLVVVPLYEASVQAIDLRFSIDGALDDETRVTALYTTTDYESGVAEENREIVDSAQQKWLLPWYPSLEERIQSRELRVIRSGGGFPVDFIGAAEQWKEDTALFLEEGGDPDDVPTAPYPYPPREPLQVRMMTSPQLRSVISVVEGEYDATTSIALNTFQPAPIMLGEDVARLARLEIGDTFFLKPAFGRQEVFEWFIVAAVVEPTDADASIWGVDDPGMMVYLDPASFDRWVKASSTTPEIDPWGREIRGLPGLASAQRWNLSLDKPTVTLEGSPEFRKAIDQFRAEVLSRGGGDVSVTSVITLLLDAFTTRSIIVGGPILAMLALVVGGALYFLVYTAALTVEREGSEVALLKSRGASSWQTVGIHLVQSAMVAIVAVMLAPIVGRSIVAVTGRVPPLSTLTGGDALRVAQVRSTTPFLIIGGVITFLAMGVAMTPYARKGVLSLRSLASRPGTESVWQKHKIDLFAIALTLVLLAQLRLRGFIDQSSGEVRLDPLAIVFPTLLLFAGALVLLRAFPYILRLVGWLLTKPRNLSTALTGWHLGRNPVPYGRLALLVWITTGIGAFALTYAATLDQSYTDRADFAAGADVRIVGDHAGYVLAPEGSVGTPVLRTIGGPRRSGRGAEVFAVVPEGFSDVVKWRGDFGAETPEEIFDLLRPDGTPPDVGIEVPADATAITIEGIIVPVSLEEEAGQSPPKDRSHDIFIRAIDGNQRVWTMEAEDPLIDSAWRTVSVDLSTALNDFYTAPPVPPFSITAVWVELVDQSLRLVVNGGSLLLGDFEAVTESGSVPLDLTELQEFEGLRVHHDVPASFAAETRFESVPEGTERPMPSQIEASALWRDGTASKWLLPEGRVRASSEVPQMTKRLEPMTVLLDVDAAQRAGLDTGEESNYTVGGHEIPGRMVGLLGKVPTAVDSRRDGVMVIDLAAYNAWANGVATWSFTASEKSIDSPSELWVATTDPDGTVRGVAAQMPDDPDSVWTIASSQAAFSSRPVQIGLVAILFIGAVTGVVLALAGVTSYVMLAVSRRAKEMGVLRSLGFERANVGFTFALEQLVVIGLGAAIGVLGGIGLVVVMLPFLQLGERAAVVEPSILLTIPRVQLAGYILVVGGLLILSVLWATRRVSTTRMSEVLREVDR